MINLEYRLNHYHVRSINTSIDRGRPVFAEIDGQVHRVLRAKTAGGLFLVRCENRRWYTPAKVWREEKPIEEKPPLHHRVVPFSNNNGSLSLSCDADNLFALTRAELHLLRDILTLIDRFEKEQ